MRNLNQSINQMIGELTGYGFNLFGDNYFRKILHKNTAPLNDISGTHKRRIE